jgi:hypothetical protein
MRRMPWAVYFWPGLPQLAHYGSWAGLLLAIGATVLLNAALLGSFVWSELIASDVRIISWLCLGIVWSVSGGFSAWWDFRRRSRPPGNGSSDPYSEALDHYLKGNWFEAERAANRLLRNNSRDLEARLMLATLLRHTKRFDDATRQLNILVRLEGSKKWEVEIRREGELLTEARNNTITSQNTAQATNGER